MAQKNEILPYESLGDSKHEFIVNIFGSCHK